MEEWLRTAWIGLLGDLSEPFSQSSSLALLKVRHRELMVWHRQYPTLRFYHAYPWFNTRTFVLESVRDAEDEIGSVLWEVQESKRQVVVVVLNFKRLKSCIEYFRRKISKVNWRWHRGIKTVLRLATRKRGIPHPERRSLFSWRIVWRESWAEPRWSYSTRSRNDSPMGRAATIRQTA